MQKEEKCQKRFSKRVRHYIPARVLVDQEIIDFLPNICLKKAPKGFY